MPVTLTQEVEGLGVGDTYTGADEAWLLAEGYASQAGYATDGVAKVTGSANAVNIVTAGNLVLRVANRQVTVALAAADTPAAAATKIDTALGADGDAAIVASKLQITSTGTGSGAVLQVVSGTGSVLANLFLTAGALAYGTDGGPGVANTGPADTTVANDPLFNTTRGARAIASDQPEGATNDGIVLSDGNDEKFANHPAAGMPISVDSYSPATGLAAGGTVVTITGHGFREVSAVQFAGTPGTGFTHLDDNTLRVTTPAHAAGAVNVTFVRADGNVVKTNAFTYS